MLPIILLGEGAEACQLLHLDTYYQLVDERREAERLARSRTIAFVGSRSASIGLMTAVVLSSGFHAGRTVVVDAEPIERLPRLEIPIHSFELPELTCCELYIDKSTPQQGQYRNPFTHPNPLPREVRQTARSCA